MTEAIAPTTKVSGDFENPAQKRRLRESCQDFEAVLAGFIFKSMRQTVLKSGEQDRATELYEAMMDEAVAKQLSRQEQMGLSQTLFDSLDPQASKKQGKR